MRKKHYKKYWHYKTFRVHIKRYTAFINRRPLTSFFISLSFLFILIVLGSLVFRPKVEEVKKEIAPKEIQVYRIGGSSKITVQAQVEKSGVIKIVAQTAGIVQSINVIEGQSINKGANLIQLASNYQGGNAFTIQTAIAAKQLEQIKETFDIQKDIIAKQRQIASQTETNFEKLRDISGQSVDETQSLIDLNQDILNTLENNLAQLEQTNTDSANSSAILQTKQLKAQLQGGLNQLKTQLRNMQFQTNVNNPPTQLAKLQKEISLKQLDIQEKSLQISKEISELQLSLAFINESLMHPVAPIDGIIERIYVRAGQFLNPGTPILTMTGNNKKSTAIAKVSGKTARKISQLEYSILHINKKLFPTRPSFIAKEATDGQLYAVIYDIPQEYQDSIADREFVNVEIPVGFADSTSTIPFIPLDAVFQTQERAIVYVVEKDKAKSKTIELGEVVGKYVSVIEGLKNGDQIILDRTVIEGDLVKTEK